MPLSTTIKSSKVILGEDEMFEAAALSIDDLCVRYGQAQAISHVSLSVPVGSITSIVGANGAGKTTLIRAIAGMVAISSGQIRYRGNRIEGKSSAAICELGIGQVPEGRQIFPSLSVDDNLRAGSLLGRARGKRKENLERVYELFPRLRERHTQQAGTLSGGEQQMLAIGRCLMSDPEFIMFDEPSLGLSPLMTETIFGIISDLAKSKLTILLVEQNVAESLTLSSYAYVLENGSIVLNGSAADLIKDARVRSAYLGI